MNESSEQTGKAKPQTSNLTLRVELLQQITLPEKLLRLPDRLLRPRSCQIGCLLILLPTFLIRICRQKLQRSGHRNYSGHTLFPDANITIPISANGHGNTQCREHEHTQWHTHFCALIGVRSGKLSILICSCLLDWRPICSCSRGSNINCGSVNRLQLKIPF